MFANGWLVEFSCTDPTQRDKLGEVAPRSYMYMCARAGAVAEVLQSLTDSMKFPAEVGVSDAS